MSLKKCELMIHNSSENIRSQVLRYKILQSFIPEEKKHNGMMQLKSNVCVSLMY